MLEVDALGLTQLDRKLLTVLIERFGGGPAGVSALAAALAEEPATRFLKSMSRFSSSLGLIERTQRGRVATRAAYEHLGKQPPEDLNQKLL
jgi:Holliday junction DNA helicase RuvB